MLNLIFCLSHELFGRPTYQCKYNVILADKALEWPGLLTIYYTYTNNIKLQSPIRTRVN